MIAALLLSLLFITLTSAFLFFLLYILYPSLEQQNFLVEDPLIMPCFPDGRDTAEKPLFLFNSPSDCHVVHILCSGAGDRQDVCAGFDVCVDTCPRLNFASPARTCIFEQETKAERAKHYRFLLQKLSAIQNKTRRKT
jgi:hypothetical protein